MTKTVPSAMFAIQPFDTPPLHLSVLESDLELRPVSRFQYGASDLTGYLFDIYLRQTDKTPPVGFASLLVAPDMRDVWDVGYVGGEIRPEFYNQGLPGRVFKAILPLANTLGIGQVLVTADCGNLSIREAVRVAGGRALSTDEMQQIAGSRNAGSQKEGFVLPTS